MPTPREMIEAHRASRGQMSRERAVAGDRSERSARHAADADASAYSGRLASVRETRRSGDNEPRRATAERTRTRDTSTRNATRASSRRETRRESERREDAARQTTRNTSRDTSRKASRRASHAATDNRPVNVHGAETGETREVVHRPQSRTMRDFVTRWRMYGVTAFAAIMVIGGFIGLLFFFRPTTSAVEMRNLTQFPAFTSERFLNGAFFTDLSLWYADTYPLREPMVAADHAIDGLFGVNTGSGMVGGNVKTDEIPVQEEKPDFSPVVPPASAPDERAVAADIQENIMSGVYVTNGAGYSIYYFSKNAADTYITAMNTAAEKLYGTSTVYSIMAPANSITLSDEEALSVGGSDQQQALDYLSTRYDTRVKAVDLIDIIKEHRDEYLYFHTDHHWTQLGAYYGYVAFCKQKGIEPKSLDDWRYVDLGEFKGTYADTVESMGYYPTDTVEGYIPSGTNDMTYWTSYGDEIQGKVVDEAAVSWEPSYKYSAFIAGDQPLEIIHNPKLDDGSSCLVVKDSYGCAFVPFLVDSYETIHVIDFRATSENICDYALENKIQDVIFMTGIKIGLTDSVAQTLLSEVS